MTIRIQKKIEVPYFEQKVDYLCGPASLQMVFGYFSQFTPQEELAIIAEANPENGTENSKMIKTAISNGFYCYVNDGSTFFEIRHFLELGLPVIINYIEPDENETHFAVVSGITKTKIILNDPWNGQNFKVSHKEFLKRWHNDKNTHKEWIMVIAREQTKFGEVFSRVEK